MTATLEMQNSQNNYGPNRPLFVLAIKRTATVSDGLWVKPDESDNVPHTVSRLNQPPVLLEYVAQPNTYPQGHTESAVLKGETEKSIICYAKAMVPGTIKQYSLDKKSKL